MREERMKNSLKKKVFGFGGKFGGLGGSGSSFNNSALSCEHKEGFESPDLRDEG